MDTQQTSSSSWGIEKCSSGFRDIKLCHREKQLLTDNTGLCDVGCYRCLCIQLAEKLVTVLWDIMTSASMRQLDNLLDVTDREGVTEAISHMWIQKYSTEASVVTLVKHSCQPSRTVPEVWALSRRCPGRGKIAIMSRNL